MFAVPTNLFPKAPRYAYGVDKENLDGFMELCVRFQLNEMHFQKADVNGGVLWLIEVPMSNDTRTGFNFMATDQGLAKIFDLNQEGEDK